MTQQEWYAATRPEDLAQVVMKFGEDEARNRRLRLFGCACIRQVWHLLPTNARSAVSVAERFAEGTATPTDLRAASIREHANPVTAAQLAITAAAAQVCRPPATWTTRVGAVAHPFSFPTETARLVARAIATEAVGRAPPGYSPATEAWHAAWTKAFDAARAGQTDYLRDLFPPPDYVARVDPRWLTSTVLALARQADDSGDFSIVPILADALQDAGCDDEIALKCCRASGNAHVRGNWVVDLVLNRL